MHEIRNFHFSNGHGRWPKQYFDLPRNRIIPIINNPYFVPENLFQNRIISGKNNKYGQ